MPGASPDGRAFLTIIRWPGGTERDGRAVFLASATGLDETTLRMRIGQEPPMILGSIPRQGALKAARAVRDAGGEAFAPTLLEISSLGETLKIKRLLAHGDGFRAELWTGEVLHFKASNIEVMIRARVETRKKGKLDLEPPDLSINSSGDFNIDF